MPRTVPARLRARARSLFAPPSRRERTVLTEHLRDETVGGALLLVAAVVAMVWANSPWQSLYTSLRDTVVGPHALHLDLTVGAWAADGLLAVFFFVAGLEVKREFVAGDLRDPARAALPVAAAVGGVLTPLALYLVVTTVTGADQRGWAVPIATDIAFALAVLAVVGSHLPTALRTFLLTLAVVDDLIAIVVIAVFFTDSLQVLPLVAAAVPAAAFGWLVRTRPPRPGRVRGALLLVPLAALTWALVHASGVHATVAGVLLAFTVPVARADGGTAAYLEHALRPFSAGLAVPVFAFFAAGVGLGGLAGAASAVVDPVALGVMAGLVVGKPLGVLVATWAVARWTRAALDESLRWIDVAGLALLSGVGFTVSLLMGELAFGAGTVLDDHAKVAVLVGSLVSAGLASVVLVARNGVYRTLEAQEAARPDPDIG